MINGTNVFPDDNPPLGGINLPATWSWAVPKQPAVALPAGASPRPRLTYATADPLGSATAWPRRTTATATSLGSAGAAAMAGWLACIVRRIGARLFRMNDAEAHWRGWEIVELHGGMSRRYRDRRFATHRAPGEVTLRPWDPQSPCDPRPPVPEPPGVHEDGGNCS
jgi:hypothetical protein